MNRKIFICSLVLGLLPITSAPAEAGVYTCKRVQVKDYDSGPYIKYVYVNKCSYKKYGR